VPRAPTRREPRPSRPTAPPAPRKRRRPEEARRLILDAAQALIAERGPDAVGLKDVAQAAAVSHALVTHYFGTYEGLVEEALIDHLERQRLDGIERIRAAADPEAWLTIAFEQFGHPLAVRLLVWALLTGRLEREDFVVFRTRGLAATVDALEDTLRAAGRTVDRDVLERSVLLGLSAVIGYTVGRKPLWGALGKRANAERDAELRAQLTRLLLASVAP
jgi:AcrR family transcriptional regulator